METTEIKPLSRQEIFNRVWDWFVVKKNPPSAGILPNGGKGCVYRGGSGERCGFGVVLPDDKYDENMEGKVASIVIKEFNLQELYEDTVYMIDPKDTIFIDSIQDAHDVIAFCSFKMFNENIGDRLEDVANKYGLNIPV